MHITPINNTMPQNKQNFTGKVYSNQTLDRYIELLNQYRNAGKTLTASMQRIDNMAKIKMEQTNNLINPLIKNDEDFLWAITPARTKDEIAKSFLETDNQVSKQNTRAIWDKVIEQLKERITKEHPQKLTKEFNETEPALKEPSHIEKIKKLKSLIKQKNNFMLDFEDKKESIAVNHYAKISRIESNMQNILPSSRPNEKLKTFLRELANRLMEKKPELKQVYKDEYKKHFNAQKNNSTKIGKLKQEASHYGYQKLELYMKYGSDNS